MTLAIRNDTSHEESFETSAGAKTIGELLGGLGAQTIKAIHANSWPVMRQPAQAEVPCSIAIHTHTGEINGDAGSLVYESPWTCRNAQEARRLLDRICDKVRMMSDREIEDL